jgi:hypothetical protein
MSDQTPVAGQQFEYGKGVRERKGKGSKKGVRKGSERGQSIVT